MALRVAAHQALCETYRVGLDGSAEQLMPGAESLSNPRWSPAGNRIAGQHGSCTGFVDRLEIVLLDATSLAPIDTIESTGLDVHPAWSPDGAELAFVRWQADLLAYAPATTQLRQVTTFDRAADFPLWSPAGSHITVMLFSPQQIAVIESSSGTTALLTPDTIIAVGGASAWLPDGRAIGFDGLRAGAETLYATDLGDGTTRRLPPEGMHASAPSVSRAGQIVLISRPAARNEMFVMRTDGTGVRRVMVAPVDLVWPLWRGATPSGTPSVHTVAGRAFRPGFDPPARRGR